MIYVALLRGINVGGKNRVEMSRLKICFEKLGYTQVTTYINSGNILFQAPETGHHKLQDAIQQAIEAEFGFPVEVVIRNQPAIIKLVEAIPDTWVNDTTMRTDVLFLWDAVDKASVLDNLGIRPGVEDVRYFPGAIVSRVDRSNATRSTLVKLIGTPLYKQITIRNINTVRKIADLMKGLGETAKS